MKPKNILLMLIIIVMIPELLLITYIFNKYSIKFEIPNIPADNFFIFLIYNPLFIVTVVLVSIIMAILYFTLRLG